MSSSSWTPIAKVYSPLQAGSIDGTDKVPHDRGVLRAMLSTYRPNKQVAGVARRTLFISRLSPETSEDTIREYCEKHGKLANVRLVKDIVTGASRRYAFVEYERSSDATHAQEAMSKTTIDNREIFVDFECERDLRGWIPRRLGGGFGGKKESGQLRFGGLDRPFRKPLSMNSRPMRGGGGGQGRFQADFRPLHRDDRRPDRDDRRVDGRDDRRSDGRDDRRSDGRDDRRHSRRYDDGSSRHGDRDRNRDGHQSRHRSEGDARSRDRDRSPHHRHHEQRDDR